MSLLNTIAADIKSITTNSNEFGVSLSFRAPNGTTATVTGLATAHHLGIDPSTGGPVNSKHAHCSFSEAALTDEDYPVRNASDDVAMVGHRVTFTDSAGIERIYRINQTFPDETIGLIVCILGDWE